MLLLRMATRHHFQTIAIVLILLAAVVSIVAQENAYFQDIFTPHEIQTRAKQKYCGKNLVEVLQLVCENGYFHQLKRNGNMLSNLETEEFSDVLGNDFARYLGIKRKIQTRGITDECCRKGCSMNELRSYCVKDA